MTGIRHGYGLLLKQLNWFIIFRILFGLLLFFATIRFWYNGWIESLYTDPGFHFKFYGFAWVDCPSNRILYLLFLIQAASALCFAGNIFPAISIAMYCLTFTYVELIDVTPYLNHYYLVSSLAFLLIFYSYKSKKEQNEWILFLVRLQLSLVYFYGGIAKLNSDWLLDAQPLRLWLIANADLPVIGDLLINPKAAYFVSWFGCLFDLCIPFLLWNRKTVLPGYILLSVFHVATFCLFKIGIFPWIMMIGTLLFFAPSKELVIITKMNMSRRLIIPVLFMVFQVIFPLRQFIYPGNRLWTEQGFRFSWNIMLIEKRGLIEFTIIDKNARIAYPVDLRKYLTDFQITMMSTQPDLILQFAHYLKKQAEREGRSEIKVTSECYVSLNGRPSQLYFDPAIDLSKISDTFAARNWLYPLENE